MYFDFYFEIPFFVLMSMFKNKKYYGRSVLLDLHFIKNYLKVGDLCKRNLLDKFDDLDKCKVNIFINIFSIVILIIKILSHEQKYC